MDTYSRRDLVGDGVSDRRLRVEVAQGRAERIRNGHYASRAAWRDAHVEERQVALARAATDAARTPPVVCRATAAAVHGLPLFRHRDSAAHLLSGDRGTGTPSAAVTRHRDRWDGDFVEVDGIRVTTLARTVFDVIRTTRVPTALACADAAIGRVSRIADSRGIDEEAAHEFRADLGLLIADHPGARGVKQARLVVELMDPRADSPGESASRLYAVQLGFTDIVVQREVRVATGARYRVDFEIDGVLGEFDGEVKYRDREMRRGRSVEQVVLDEKRREDEIRAATGQRMIRWTNREIRSRSTFDAFLRDHGIHTRQSTRSARAHMK
ncbi:hypothetical protein [Microbacterium karelineae]|uniref:hypothetical protein n=1 Tax=Microbacterium karelineae TaxID=2654283 RepID=UPI0012E9D49F|nr:hypothetical protein [Microbacterium karelineae]